MVEVETRLETKDLQITKLEVTDATLLSEVALKAYADHYLHLWHDNGQWYMNKYFSVENLAKELQDTNAGFYLAYFQRLPAGFLKINIDAPLPVFKHQNALELERIYLTKEAAGKGIGTELVQLVFSIARKQNKDIVWLKAMDTSEGPISFYHKMRFKNIGTHRLKHPLMKEELRGMVILAKELRDL